MSTDPQNNRSSAPTPESLGASNAQSTALVNETIAAMFAHLGPLMEKLALTPEKMREMNKPYVDPAKVARDLRETQLWREDMEAQRKQTQLYQDQCLHEDENNRSSIRPTRNWPDRQPRGICMKCHAQIHPKEWRIGPPDAQNPRGRAYLADAHKDYLRVLQVIAKEGS